jgi:dTDP-6-deoxy-L-talose 4-dehydrogenase (NAD+)
MKVAVTGAGGFIGRHVLAQLQRRGVEAIAVIRSANAMAGLGTEKCIQFDIHDAKPEAYKLMGRPDALIHLAWGGLPNYSSLHHFEDELPGHYRFLRDLVEAGLPVLTVAGTCFEYGMLPGCLSETAATLPANPYGYAKDALRRQLTFLQEKRPFRLIWGRLFYLYGPGQSCNSLLPQLEQAVARGDRCFNMSGGEQLRDYLPVEVVAEHLVTLTLSGQNVGVVNICSGTPVSVRKLVEEWLFSRGWTIDLNFGHYPYPDHEPMAFWGNSEKLKRVLDIR